MNLLLQRRPSFNSATVGELFIDGEHQCYTCEDQVRAPGVKIDGETAIPAGRYRVTITWSPAFNRNMPLINDVPGFTGVRIHIGNTIADTRGCILVGRTCGTTTVSQSLLAFSDLYPKIEAALQDGGECWIDVRDA